MKRAAGGGGGGEEELFIAQRWLWGFAGEKSRILYEEEEATLCQATCRVGRGFVDGFGSPHYFTHVCC